MSSFSKAFCVVEEITNANMKGIFPDISDDIFFNIVDRFQAVNYSIFE